MSARRPPNTRCKNNGQATAKREFQQYILILFSGKLCTINIISGIVVLVLYKGNLVNLLCNPTVTIKILKHNAEVVV